MSIFKKPLMIDSNIVTKISVWQSTRVQHVLILCLIIMVQKMKLVVFDQNSNISFLVVVWFLGLCWGPILPDKEKLEAKRRNSSHECSGSFNSIKIKEVTALVDEKNMLILWKVNFCNRLYSNHSSNQRAGNCWRKSWIQSNSWKSSICKIHTKCRIVIEKLSRQEQAYWTCCCSWWWHGWCWTCWSFWASRKRSYFAGHQDTRLEWILW